MIERLDVPPSASRFRASFIDWVAQYSMAPRGMALRAVMSAKAAFKPVKPKMGVRLGAHIPNKVTEARQKVLAGGRRSGVEQIGAWPNLLGLAFRSLMV